MNLVIAPSARVGATVCPLTIQNIFVSVFQETSGSLSPVAQVLG